MNFKDCIKFANEKPELVIFRVPKGEAYFWTMETNLV